MSEKDISTHLREINHLIFRELSSYKQTTIDNDVSQSGGCIIAYLHDHKDRDIFQRDIEEKFNVRRSTVSTVISLLEENGYIKRVAVSYDRRLKKIVLTDKACGVVETIKADRKRLNEKITCGLSEKDLEVFTKTLQKIKQNLQQEEKI